MKVFDYCRELKHQLHTKEKRDIGSLYVIHAMPDVRVYCHLCWAVFRARYQSAVFVGVYSINSIFVSA